MFFFPKQKNSKYANNVVLTSDEVVRVPHYSHQLDMKKNEARNISIKVYSTAEPERWVADDRFGLENRATREELLIIYKKRKKNVMALMCGIEGRCKNCGLRIRIG